MDINEALNNIKNDPTIEFVPREEVILPVCYKILTSPNKINKRLVDKYILKTEYKEGFFLQGLNIFNAFELVLNPKAYGIGSEDLLSIQLIEFDFGKHFDHFEISRKWDFVDDKFDLVWHYRPIK